MLKLLKEDLDKQGVFDGQLPDFLRHVVDAIPNQNINYRMKLTIAVSEMVLFASHLRRNIKHWNGSSIPINAISFSLAASGDGKDSSVTAARKCFSEGYKILEKKRKDVAKKKAIAAATKEGKENPEKWENYRDYYQTPNPLFVAPSTSEGFIQHLNDLDSAGIGAGYMQSGEFGGELVTGGLIIDNIKLLAEIYDEGKKEVKVLKARENQSKEIVNLPVSALFMGSQENILYDDNIKKIFKREFSTKLARRSFFNFNPKPVQPMQYDTVDAMLKAEKAIEDRAIDAQQATSKVVADIAQHAITGVGASLTVEPEVRELFLKYKRYNEEAANEIKAQFTISKLVKKHLQWKALKLSGAIALFNGHNEITKDDYISAISFVEMLNEDMILFEQELVKEPYEVFVDYMHSIANDGKSSASMHSLRKLGYIPKSGTPTTRMKELIHLAASYDKNGIYTLCEDGICYERQIITDSVGVSYMPVSGNKEQRKKQCAVGYEFFETEFEDYAQLLEEDLAYSPFRFKTAEEGASWDKKKFPNPEGGIRGKDNILGGCKFVVLDVDNSTMTDEEAHFLLQDINHHIARTSNADNPYKYRVLIELDAVVDIPDIQWKYFIQSIADNLMLQIDFVPKSQIFFSYADRNVLSTTDADPLSSKSHVMFAAEAKPQKEKRKISAAEAKTALADPLGTFFYAYEAMPGTRSRSLIRAAYHARDLKASNEDIIELVKDINTYWDDPLEDKELERNIFSQINRF